MDQTWMMAENNREKTEGGEKINSCKKAENCEDAGKENAGKENAGKENAGKKEAAGVAVPRILLAAPHSGSGKTLLTCGLLRLLQKKGIQPAAFKCGPDYIDPMFHRQVLKVPSRNLDTFFTPDGGTRTILARAMQSREPGLPQSESVAAKADIAVIEGVMGYFDGTGKSGTEASAFDLALQTQTPVILLVDAKSMGRSVSALVKGFRDFELQLHLPRTVLVHTERPLIRGIVLNRISPGMYPVMKRWIEEDTGIPVVGYLPVNMQFELGSRHLGLLMPEEIQDLEQKIELLADTLSETLDLAQLLSIAGTAPDLELPSEPERSCFPASSFPVKAQRLELPFGHKGFPWQETPSEQEPASNQKGSQVRVAVAKDEAFNFYYEDNLELLQEAGAELVFFSPLHDKELPAADGLLLGGGYPELFVRELAENTAMKESICRRAAEGMPVLAECGGFMYLQEYLEEQDGNLQEMCGVLRGACRRTDRLVRFGYVELEGNAVSSDTGFLSEGHRIRGHEFHYYDSSENGDACTAWKPGRSRSWQCVVVHGNIMAGFPHLYYRSDPEFAMNFVRRCRMIQR